MTPEKLSVEYLTQMELPNVIVYAVPVMLSLVALEWIISIYQKKESYDSRDTAAAAAIGIGNILVSAAVKVGIFALVVVFYNISPFRIPPTWWSYLLCFVALDFARYWAHRVAHEQRFWWATHVTHHNSKKYNWSVSFRLSWTQHIKIVFFLPVVMMGFDPFVFFICHQTLVLYQFWIHTEYIKKLPAPIEYIFVTPSHHRVHHATNAQYIDRNYGSTFIIWDRMFGTFQPEEEQAIYGITKNVDTYNPITLVFHEWVDIFHDLGKAKSLREAWWLVWGNPTAIARAKVTSRTEEVQEED
jgi:sterol desaturase/sphingolipid hydroxylase (fatty acid hydroxylase superfamily)